MSSLVLLIGTNPLPNFVTANFMLSDNPDLKNIFLIYSEKTGLQQSTKEFAENIITVLCDKYDSTITQINFVLVPISDVDSAKVIRNDCSGIIESIDTNETVYLNYTGGTKVMVVHIYNLLKEGLGDRLKTSYLSPKIFRLIDDNGTMITDNLRNSIKVSFKELIKLHGFERINKDRDFNFNDSLDEFVKLIENDTLSSFYNSDGGYNRKSFLNDKDKLTNKFETLEKNLKEITISGSFLNINSKLPEDYQIFDINGKLRKHSPPKDSLKVTLRFFDGNWLEMYVGRIFQEEYKEKNNISIYCNWEIRKPEWRNISSDAKFELDVIIIRGYQLFGISCTTDDTRSLCKSKGFEIIHRTKQIGGDEAKSILISRLSRSHTLELNNELALETGSRENILVLGQEDLKHEILIKKIKTFMGD